MTREDIKRRLKALRERTVGRGCTEAEALVAAEKLAKLMSEYGLSDADLDFVDASVHTRWAWKPPTTRLWSTISICTNSALLVREKDKGRDVLFYGREPGPEIASYLLDVCQNAIRNETTKFRAGAFYQRRKAAKTKRAAVNDFQTGMIIRLCERLLHLFAESRSEDARSQALAHRDRLNPNAESMKVRPTKAPRFDEAVNAGWTAGGGVNLVHGVGTGAVRKLIGGVQ